jgi:ATP-binding cassette, subfamily B, bacterial PglK
MKSFFQILSLLDQSIKRSSIFMLLLIMIGMLLEMLGIGLFIPIIMGLLDPNFLENFPSIEYFFSNSLNLRNDQIVLFSLLLLIIFYMFKTFYMVFLAFKQGHFIFNIRRKVSENLYHAYLCMPYSFHLNKNSSEIIRNINNEIGLFTSGLRALIIIVIDSFLLLGVIAVLIYLEPMGTLIIAPVMALTVVAIRYFTKDRVIGYGQSRQKYDSQRIKHIQHTIGGIKDIKISSMEDEFYSSFKSDNLGGITAERKQFTLGQLPKLLLEFVVVFCVGSLVVMLISMGKDTNSITLTLSVLAIAIFRMLPSVNRVTNASQQFRYTIPSFRMLYGEMRSLNKTQREVRELIDPEATDVVFNNQIIVNDLNYKYPDTDDYVLKDINIRIPCNAMIGIIGESGAGKSTFVNLLLGLLHPTSGKILVDGQNIDQIMKKWQKLIGYVPQQTFLLDDSLKRNITFSLNDKDLSNESLKNSVNSAQLNTFVDSLSDGYDTIVGERGSKLSGGQQQRIGIARALYNNPSVLVLDEATSNLDLRTEARVIEAVKQLKGKKTIIIISHRASTLEYCDLLFEIKDGKIILSD